LIDTGADAECPRFIEAVLDEPTDAGDSAKKRIFSSLTILVGWLASLYRQAASKPLYISLILGRDGGCHHD
jgi:hypothetical protein